MTLFRLCWHFGLREGLAKWLLPALEKERRRSDPVQEAWGYTPHGTYVYKMPPDAQVTYTGRTE